MSARSTARLRRALSAGLTGLLLLVASPSLAGECDALFPDLNCEGRQARPEGSVMPMSFPYIFEDPYITTGLNAVGIYHGTPNDSVFAGGDIGILALQARLAITDRLAFIATKDGFGWIDSDHPSPAVRNTKGFFNITAGLKYAAWQWKGDGEGESAILSPSLRYEIPLGEKDVFQGNDSGAIIPALSGGYHNDGWNVIGDLGGQWGLDRDKSSSSLFYNLHVSHAFAFERWSIRFLVPFIELNGLYYVRSGEGRRKLPTQPTLRLKTGTAALGLPPFEGVDAANLGSDTVAGNNIVTMAWGLRLPLDNDLSLGASYERPLSNRRDIWEERVTVMLTWEL
jgi:hypothetical protein